MQSPVSPSEFSLLRLMMRDVWDTMGSMVQGQGSLQRIIIADIDQTARHSSSCFQWINSFIPFNNL